MNTQTNHGAAIPLPTSGIGSQIVRAIKHLREQSAPGTQIWVVWAMDVENACIEEERQQLRYRDPDAVETPDSEAQADRGVKFLTHRKVPQGMWYVTTTRPDALLDDDAHLDQVKHQMTHQAMEQLRHDPLMSRPLGRCESRDPRDGRQCEMYLGHPSHHFRAGAAGGWSP